jgi:hypothetical protein
MTRHTFLKVRSTVALCKTTVENNFLCKQIFPGHAANAKTIKDAYN